MSVIADVSVEIERAFAGIPTVWNGKDAILEMKNADNAQWRQMEWIGFYFQFLCEKYLAHLFTFQKPEYGNASFDGLYKLPFDFKAHAANTSSHKIPVNDREAVEFGIRDYGAVGLIIAVGDVVYNDENRTFQKWHDELKGAPSRYVMANKERGAWSRLRKCSLTLKQISIIEITEKTLEKCGSFQTGFKNSDGRARREKIEIDLEKLDTEIICCIDYK